MTASSTSLLRSPLNRDGCHARSSSTLMAESAATCLTPCSAASASSVGAASAPTARGWTNNVVTPCSAATIVSGRDTSPRTISTPAGRPSAGMPVWRARARTCSPAAASTLTRGRPMVPVAPVTSITVDPFAGLPRCVAVVVAGKGCARFGLVRESVLRYGVGAAGLGSSAGLRARLPADHLPHGGCVFGGRHNDGFADRCRVIGQRQQVVGQIDARGETTDRINLSGVVVGGCRQIKQSRWPHDRPVQGAAAHDRSPSGACRHRPSYRSFA